MKEKYLLSFNRETIPAELASAVNNVGSLREEVPYPEVCEEGRTTEVGYHDWVGMPWELDGVCT